MTTYEISVWEDYYDNDLGRYCERRLAIIGQSNMHNSGVRMDAQCCAREPKLVNNVNGTNTFTFTMYYSYVSNDTGEIEYNPYVPLLINERKIKVFWRDQWYDFVIKDMKKSSDKKTITYTCKDLFINELSKNSIRPLNNFSKEKITSLNNLYDQFKKKKETLNETNNSIVNKNINNIENNNSLLNESLNTFTQNLNKKWKDLTKDDIKNMKNIRERNYNEETSNNNIIENTTLEYDKFEDEKIFDKVNQFTKVALNELKQSELSVFNKEKTIKKNY